MEEYGNDSIADSSANSVTSSADFLKASLPKGN